MHENRNHWTMRRNLRAFTLCGALVVLTAVHVTAAAHAEDSSAGDESATKLAKETQNPVANLISVPFQNNFNFNTGSKNRTIWILMCNR